MFLLRRPDGPDNDADKIIATFVIQLEVLPGETMKEHNRCIASHKEEKAMKF